MRKTLFVFIFAAVLLLCGCQKTEPEKLPVTANQETVEKQPDCGSVFARTAEREFYYLNTDGKTKITLKSGETAVVLAELDGAWRFSLLEQSTAYDYMLFDGYREAPTGYSGSLYMYEKATNKFFPLFDVPTSNAVLLPTTDEDYADLAWLLFCESGEPLLCPINLLSGSIEHGQIVSLADTDYIAAQENTLVSLSTDAKQPYTVKIENKVYEGSSILSTTAYLYSFEDDTLIKITEEE